MQPRAACFTGVMRWSCTHDADGGAAAACSVTCLEYGQLYVMSKADLIAFTKTVPRLRLLCWGGVCFE